MPAGASSFRLPRGWHLVVAAALLAHLAIGAFRLPGVVFSRRWQDVADYRARGAIEVSFARNRLRGADVVRWIVANVPADGVVPFEGDSKGALEFVPGLIAPRLLVRAAACARGANTYAGRPVAMRTGDDGSERPVVVRSTGDELRLEDR